MRESKVRIALKMTQSDHPFINFDNESVCHGLWLMDMETSKIVICMQHAFFADIAMNFLS